MKVFLAAIFCSFIFAINFPPVSRAETYSTTFTKEGKTYVVSKTVSSSQITIETKIYDSGGNLIDTKVTHKNAQPTPVKTLPSVYPSKSAVKPSSSPSPTATPTPIMVKSDIPVRVDEKSAEMSLETPDGPLKMAVSPETITLSAKNLGLTDISEIRISPSDAGKMQYRVRGTKQQKLFAFIPIGLPTQLVFNYETGTLEKTDQPILVKLVDIISF